MTAGIDDLTIGCSFIDVSFAFIERSVRLNEYMKKLLPLFILLLTAAVHAETFTVTRSDDRDELCVSGIDCSLREAVKAANLAPTDDVIIFPAI